MNNFNDLSGIDPNKDGISHINIYSKGNTTLGRMLSNFYKFPIMTDDGKFLSVEGYWYWMGIPEEYTERENLRQKYGFYAKKLGKELLEKCNSNERIDPDFEHKILKAIWHKFRRNSHMILPQCSEIPFMHYYNYGGKIVDVTHRYPWMIDGITKMRDYLYKCAK